LTLTLTLTRTLPADERRHPDINPCTYTYRAKNRFQNVPFKPVSTCSYVEVAMANSMMCVRNAKNAARQGGDAR
jgi:hypothetical protein